MGMVLGAQRVDRVVDGDQRPLLMREVLPPREALCDSCLDVDRRRRRASMMRAIWVSAVLYALAAVLRMFA